MEFAPVRKDTTGALGDYELGADAMLIIEAAAYAAQMQNSDAEHWQELAGGSSANVGSKNEQLTEK